MIAAHGLGRLLAVACGQEDRERGRPATDEGSASFGVLVHQGSEAATYRPDRDRLRLGVLFNRLAPSIHHRNHIEAQNGRQENYASLTFSLNLLTSGFQIGNGRVLGVPSSYMQKLDAAGPTPLVLEMASGTALVHGEAVELPLRELKLLAELAKHVGQPVETSALIAAAWPEAPWTTPQDLYVLVSKLRRLIDGTNRFGQNIRNRRGFGYLLDLPAGEVVVRAGAASEDDMVIDLRDEEAQEETPAGAQSVPLQPSSSATTTPLREDAEPSTVATSQSRGLRVILAVALTALLVAVSWATGFTLSKRFSRPSEERAEIAQPPSSSEKSSAKAEEGETPNADKKGPARSRRRAEQGSGKDPSSDPSIAFAAPPPTTALTDGSTPESSGSAPATIQDPADKTEPEDSDKGWRVPNTKDPAPPQLPPAPTRYLYHLVHAKTGDHLVTTDSNTASDHEAMGYQGGAIARIYTYQEDNTRGVTTNHGTAYVFISSAPKTAPASRTLPLWYSTDNDGDFFYTTIESEAKQSGWAGSLIGYVRSL
ncbi:MAG: helix-turn-helix domain-containing protein [Actinobacteria bacterium]|nr:helix-turn-helix domain-containing protein [Actinomycetota bacterium]